MLAMAETATAPSIGLLLCGWLWDVQNGYSAQRRAACAHRSMLPVLSDNDVMTGVVVVRSAPWCVGPLARPC